MEDEDTAQLEGVLQILQMEPAILDKCVDLTAEAAREVLSQVLVLLRPLLESDSVSPLAKSKVREVSDRIYILSQQLLREILEAKVQNRLAPLTPADRACALACLEGPASEAVLIEKFSIPITRRLMAALRPKEWLNDEVCIVVALLLMSFFRSSPLLLS